MVDMQAIEKSMKHYDEAKVHFASLALPDCVIEVLPCCPPTDWPVHFTPTDEAMTLKRIAMSSFNKSFICIYKADEGTHFFFTDYIITKIEVLETHDVILFDIEDPDEFDIKAVMQEFQELKKQLQNG